MQLLQILINGILLGSGYALLAVGYTLVFGVARLLTLAQGAIFVASGIVAAMAMRDVGAPIWVAGLIAVGTGGVGGLLTDLLCFRPLIGRSGLAPAVATIGLALAIQQGVVLLAGSTDTISVPVGVGAGDLELGSLLVSGIDVVTLGLSLVLMACIELFVSRTTSGAALRAMAENQEAAELTGIDVRAVATATLVVSGCLAGLASFMFALRRGGVSPISGLQTGLLGLAVITIGGLGSLRGALVAGLGVGVVSAAADYLGFGWISSAIVWLGVLVALAVRPGSWAVRESS